MHTARFVTAGTALLLLGGLALEAAPARPKKQYTIEQFMATTAVGGASFSPDESKVLFSSNETGVPNVYSVPVAGGTPTALTSSKESTYAVSYFPADERILFTRDPGGNELNHLYVRETDGQEKDLTPGEKLKAIFQGFTKAGEAFWVLTNERDPRYFDLYRYDAKTYARTCSTRTRWATSRRRLRRRRLRGPRQGADHGRQRRVSLRDGHEEDDPPHPAPGAGGQRGGRLRPRGEGPLLPDQRRRRVRPGQALRPRLGRPRGSREGRLGRDLHEVLEARTLPADRHQ